MEAGGGTTENRRTGGHPGDLPASRGAGAQPDAIALLWQPRPARRRGPRPALTPEAIARAAIAVADADGLAAVTMQRVAEGLGITKMALYRYLPGRRELIALMTDLALGPPAESAGGWRVRLEAWARSAHERFRRHPWALEATTGPRPLGPNEVAWMDQAVAALTDTGLDGGEMLDIAATLIGHVRSLAQQSSAMPGAAAPEQAMLDRLAGLLSSHADRYPALTAAVASARDHGAWGQALDFGLARILDGLEAYLASRRRSAGGRATPPGDLAPPTK
jgi:AcrR family transcriptional regulator